MKNTMGTVTIATSEYEELKAKKAELEALVKYYEEQLRLAKHLQFGSSSEKNGFPEQLGLFDEAENTSELKASELDLEEITYKRRKRIGNREDDFSSLPVETIEYSLSESEQICSDCGSELVFVRHEVRKELKIVPATASVTLHKRDVYCCNSCQADDGANFVKASAPAPVIQNSVASASAIAHIMVQKYVMCVPLYRQEQAWLREGISLSRQTMANWVIKASADWLEPLYYKLREHLLTHEVLHADETVCQVLKEPGKKANTNSYMWLYRTSGDTVTPTVLFEYQPTRSSSHPKRFLDGWHGYLHADGYSGYHNLPPNITVVGCLVHLRRKFEAALKILPENERSDSREQEAIHRIGKLFHLEDLWQNNSPFERQKLRLEQAKLLYDDFFIWLNSLRRIVPKSAMGKAISYANDQKKWVDNFFLDGRLELSNNRAENAIRPFVMGRKNWLFCNSQHGARASSVIYSIIETAKANGLKPFDYLNFLFETLPNTTSSHLDRLLPWSAYLPDICKTSSSS